MSHNLTLSKRGHPEVVLRQTPTIVTQQVMGQRREELKAQTYLDWVFMTVYGLPNTNLSPETLEWLATHTLADKADFPIEMTGIIRWKDINEVMKHMADYLDFYKHEAEVLEAVKVGYSFGSI